MTAPKSAAIDIVKGVLILIVIAGHNEALMQSAPWARRLFYYFNTQCFFLLSSLLDAKLLSRQLIRDRAVRYLVPFACFMIVAWIAFITLRESAEPLPVALGDLGRALVVGSDAAIYQAVGMRYLWFLPALFSLVMIKAAASRWPAVGTALTLAAWVLIVGTAFIPAALVKSVPLNAAIGLFFFGLGEVFRKAFQAASRLPDTVLSAAAVAATVALSALIVLVPLDRVAGANICTYDVTHWATWVVALVFPCCLLVALFTTSSFLPLRAFLEFCGRYSLPLYLIHMLLYRVLTLAWFGRAFDDLATVGADFPAGLAIFFLTTAGSLALTLLIWRVAPLRRLIFPRDWNELMAAFGRVSA